MVYEGNEKYIFVSYAHKDAQRVLPIIDTMTAAGYRIWFDSGIEAGTEWPEYIEDHLMNSHVVLVFLSPSAIESRNCRNEINFALELKKEILVVYLEETTLLKGMRLQLNSTQSLFRTHHESDETFLQELLRARILKDCRADISSAPNPQYTTESQPAEAPKPTPEPAPAPAPEPKPAPEPAAEPKPAPQPAPELPKQPAPAGKSRLPVFAMLGAVLVALVILICVIVGGKDSGNSPAPHITTAPLGTIGNAGQSELSDNLLDFTIEIEGVVYKLPCRYEDFTANGWTIADNISDTSKIASTGSEAIKLAKNGKRFTVFFYNMSGNAKALRDCLVGGLEIEKRNDLNFKLAKGINLHSTPDEILAAYGTPTDQTENNDALDLTYRQDGSSQSRIRFYLRKGQNMDQYSSVTFRNFIKTAEDHTETNTQKPAYLDSYKAPSALGTDISVPAVKIGGDLYQLPAPVSAFTANGWTVQSQPGFLGSGNADSLTVDRNGITMTLYVANFSEYQTTPENCAVYKVNIDAGENIGIELPGGITMGMGEAALTALLTEDFKYYDYSGYDSWAYSNSANNLFISINIDDTTKTVTKIVVDCETWHYE